MKRLSKISDTRKAKWVAALESGAYEQGRGQLKTAQSRDPLDVRSELVTTYCCLGVLREIDKRIKEKKAFPCGFNSVCYLDKRSCGIPQEVQEKLADMNDSGRSFKQIARYIKRYL